MKRAFLFVFLFFQVIYSIAQFNVGGFGGYSRSKYTGDTPPEEIYGWSGGLILGLTSSYDLSQAVSLELDANITENNTFYQVYDDKDEELKVDSAEIRLLAIGLPIGVMVKGNNNRFYVKSAFELQFPISAKIIRIDSENDLLHQIKDVTLAFQFGAGYIIPIGKPKLVVEVNYTQGLTNIASDKISSDYKFTMDRTKLEGVRFKLGIEYSLGKKTAKNSPHD